QLEAACERTVIDLHNVESVLHERCASVSRGLVAAGHKRFAAVSQRLEHALLPRFGLVLAASEADRDTVVRIAPTARAAVYPNALRMAETPRVAKQPVVPFAA